MRKVMIAAAVFVLLIVLCVPALAGTAGGGAWYGITRYEKSYAVRGVFATMTCPRSNARGTVRSNSIGVSPAAGGNGVSAGWEIDSQGNCYAKWTGAGGAGVLMPLAYGSAHRFGVKRKDFTPGTTEYYVDGRRIITVRTGVSWGLPLITAARNGATSNVSDFTGVQVLDNDGNTWKNASLPNVAYDNDPVYNSYQPQAGWIAVR